MAASQNNLTLSKVLSFSRSIVIHCLAPLENPPLDHLEFLEDVSPSTTLSGVSVLVSDANAVAVLFKAILTPVSVSGGVTFS